MSFNEYNPLYMFHLEFYNFSVHKNFFYLNNCDKDFLLTGHFD